MFFFHLFSFIFVVHTRPENSDFRSVIRQTWGEQKLLDGLNAKIYFFVGRSEDLRIEVTLKAEQEKHGDLVQSGVKLAIILN